jgi:Mg-chelatase subunit ChlI
MPNTGPTERLFKVYPFTAVVAQEAMKRALLCAVIEPALHGVLVRGERGTAKSTAARALTRLLPEQPVVAGCPYGCDPDAPQQACAACYERLTASPGPGRNDEARAARCGPVDGPAADNATPAAGSDPAVAASDPAVAASDPAVAASDPAVAASDPAAAASDPAAAGPPPVERAWRRVPFVSLPVSATEDRVVGTLDLERAVLHGEQRFSPGVLAEAHRGLLYIDEVNLLPDHVMDLLLDVAAMGVNLVEREGVAFSHPSRFLLVGTMNPEEGELRPQLTDRFDLSVVVRGERDLATRQEVLRRRLAYERSPANFVASYAAQEAALSRELEAARARLPDIAVPPWAEEAVCQTSNELEVDGHRAELAALKAARALAALDDAPVDEPHLAEAIDLAYGHRLRRRPFEQEHDGEERLAQVVTRLRTADAPGRDDERPSPGLPPGKKNT